MSGNTIGTIIGGAVGFVVGGPAGIGLGMSLGGVAGGFLMPDEVGLQDQEGPKLHDLKVTGASYGLPLGKVYGSYRVGGNIFWSLPIKETKHEREEEVGKGGGEEYTVTWYTYSVDMAISLCEGQITGVRKIWADSVLIYDISEDGPITKYRASNLEGLALTFYDGSPDQPIDWFLQSNEPDSPAYRNTAYIVFNNFQLARFGNRIPNITAEVVADGVKTTYIQEGPDARRKVDFCPDPNHADSQTLQSPIKQFHSRDYDIVLYNGGTYGDVGACRFADAYKVQNNDFSQSYVGRFQFYYTPNSPAEAEQAYSDSETEMCFVTWGGPFDDPYSWIRVYPFSGSGLSNKQLYVPSGSIPGGAYWAELLFYRKGTIYSFYKAQGNLTPIELVYSGIPEVDVGQGYPSVTVDTDGIEDLNTLSMYVGDGNAPYIYFFNRYEAGRFSISIRRKNKIINTIPFYFQHDIQSPFGFATNMYVDEVLNFCYLYYDTGGSFLHRIDLTTGEHVYYSLPITATSSHFTNFHVDDNVLRVFHGTKFKYIALDVLQANQVTLSSIIQDLFQKSNLLTSDYNLSETDSILMKGFYVGKTMSARAAVSVLQVAELFDLIEDEFQIRTYLRGKSSSKTILSDDLRANTSDSVEHKKKLLTELPKKVTVKYPNQDIDYQDGAQSTLRIDGSSDHNLTFELPVVLDDTSAKRICEINMFRVWFEKDSYNFSAPSSYLDMRVGHVVTLQYANVEVDVRLIKVIITTDNILQCESVRESSYTNIDSYNSKAIGSSTSIGKDDEALTLPSVSSIAVLNAPTLDNNLLDSKNVYIAASGYAPGWKGCQIFKSNDNGQNYNTTNVILNPTYHGVSTSTLASGPTTVWDLVNTVEVSLEFGTLETLTEQEVLNGGNYAILGSEVIQFVEATFNSDKSVYVLSKLLRGRRGTEWAIGTHGLYEVFSLLNYNMVFDLTTLNLSSLYKAVTFGKSLDESREEENTYTGVNLVPFEPASFEITTDSPYEYNDSITWMRRDRYVSGYLRALPLSEDKEEYVLNIYDNNDALVRTEVFTDQYQFSYTRDMKISDGLTLGYDVRYDIYQRGTYFDGYIKSIIETYTQSYVGYLLSSAHHYWRLDEPEGTTTTTLVDLVGTDDIIAQDGVLHQQAGSLPNSPNTGIITNDNYAQSSDLTTNKNNHRVSLMFSFNTITSDDVGYMFRCGTYQSDTDVSGFICYRYSSSSIFLGRRVFGVLYGVTLDIDPNAGWLQIFYTYDWSAGQHRYFINGELVGTHDSGVNGCYYITVGAFCNNCTKINVHLDEFAYWEKVQVSDSQVAEIYRLSQLEYQ